jgi:hypothetical protein
VELLLSFYWFLLLVPVLCLGRDQNPSANLWLPAVAWVCLLFILIILFPVISRSEISVPRASRAPRKWSKAGEFRPTKLIPSHFCCLRLPRLAWRLRAVASRCWFLLPFPGRVVRATPSVVPHLSFAADNRLTSYSGAASASSPRGGSAGSELNTADSVGRDRRVQNRFSYLS